jgi:hypothetical protein
VIASLPLFLLAEALPGLGLMQTVWLLNIVVTAATAVLLCHYARLLGYGVWPALGAGLVFGAATFALPYTKTFFREPLFTLLALCTVYAAERWRRATQPCGQIRWLAGCGVGLFAAFITKDAAIFLLPALLVALAPAAVTRLDKMDRRSLLIIGGVIVATLLIVVILPRFVAVGRFDIVGRIRGAILEADEAPYALAGYLFSPGRGIFAFSPALLLGIPGLYVLIRNRRWREVLLPVLMLLTFSIGYAILQNRNWYGGTAWGPRYMLPLMPFLTLLTLPILERFGRLPVIARGLISALIGGSAALQLVAAYVPLHDYYRFLSEESARLGRIDPPLVGWIEGTWDVRYIPQVVLPQIVNKAPLDLAWWVNQAAPVVIACLILMLIGGVLLMRPRRRVFPIAFAALIVLLYGGLRAAYPDPRYGGSDPNAAAALNAVYANLQPGSAVLLGSDAYRPHFMNYYKDRAPIYQLSASPGEVDIPGRPPRVVANNPDALIAPEMGLLLARDALRRQRWLYVTEFVPGDTSRLRVMERYLVRHYHPIREVLTTDAARVIAFSTRDAPPDYIPPWPATFTNARFGDLITLVGYDAPLTVRAGEVLPISLLWKMERAADFDYSVNVSLVAPDGSVQAQRAGTPQGTFGRLTTWKPGGYYRDNHGLAVPPNAPRGEYQVWVLLYNWQDNSRLPLMGNETEDLLVLMRVRVE